MSNSIKSMIKNLPGLRDIVSERDHLRSELNALRKVLWQPPGHFYSPIHSSDDIEKDAAQIFKDPSCNIPGIEMRETAQLALAQEFSKYYSEMPFKADRTDGLRYYYGNDAYSYSDAIFLHCMIRHLKPKRMIEIGSGFSSCMTLDTNELFLDGKMAVTFIEPYPELLMSLMNEEDKSKHTVLSCRLQDVPLSQFEDLEENDILFVDSTHVSKVNSDVNRIFFDILPILNPGVYIHFHDVFYPFEYPRNWLLEGRAWNEIYTLRAFLQFNSAFEVVLMNTFLESRHEAFFAENMPLCLKNRGGSIWLRKLSGKS